MVINKKRQQVFYRTEHLLRLKGELRGGSFKEIELSRLSSAKPAKE
jgi:hypothetical protein